MMFVTLKMCVNVPLFLLLQITQSVSSGPLIQLPNGIINGREATTFNNRTYSAFEKIPYATPPIGELRFKDPQPPQNWSGILETKHLDVVCYQLNRPGPESEDCLYLNVFTPKINGSLPVMFYIHGGGFYDGSAIPLWPDRFMDNDVIYVTVNYRLGPFGFLSTDDKVIPGNYGLKDQLMALEWVHKNIHLFGGDRTRVTIFGHSSGAASVSFLQLNKKADGLFSGVIIQSGTCLGVWALQREPKTTAFTYAGLLLNNTFRNGGINENNSQKLLEYLQSLPPQELKKASQKFYFEELFGKTADHTSSQQGYYFGPVIETKTENAFLSEKMYRLIQNGTFIKVPALIGFTSEECLEHLRDLKTFIKNMKDYDEHLEWLIPSSMEYGDKINKTHFAHVIRNIYTGGAPFSKNIADGIRFCSDNLLTRPMMKHAELYSKFVETYFYEFSYDGALGGINVTYPGIVSVGHGEENKYLICSGSKCDLKNYTIGDKITQERLIKIWTNFAKFRNPTPESTELLQNISWPLLSTNDGAFLYVDIGENLKIKNYPKETYKGWKKLFGNLSDEYFATY